MEARKQGKDIFKVLKEKNCHTKIPYIGQGQWLSPVI
jgi:hypothetical protein